MKRKFKVVKPIHETTMTELIARSNEITKRLLKTGSYDLAAAEKNLRLSKELNAEVAAFCDNLNRQIKEKEDLEKIRREEEEEAQRVRRIINPNFPDQEWRPYFYQELFELCREWANDPKHSIRVAFIRSGMKRCKADIDFYHAGDYTKAKFYPTELCWVNFTLIIDGKPLKDRQREINNLEHLTEYSCTNPKQLIPDSSSMWRRRLFVFTQIHEN